MTAIARLEITPIREQHMSEEIARAVTELEDFDVEYEITPVGTVIEAEDVGEIYDAAKAAHEAVDVERVITDLEVDDHRPRDQHAESRVEAVEREMDQLGQD